MVQKIRRGLSSGQEAEKQTDQENVEKVRRGDRAAFSNLVRQHQRGLYRLCLRFVKDPDAAEDVVQESFIKAYEKLGSFEGRSSFKSWLYQIAVNTAKNRLRDKREGPRSDEIGLAVGPQAEAGLVKAAVSRMIQAHVEALPLKQRTALVLRVFEDLSFKEIAEIMECPYDTAKANYRHGLMKLRDELMKQPELRHWTEETGTLMTEIHRKVAEVES